MVAHKLGGSLINYGVGPRANGEARTFFVFSFNYVQLRLPVAHPPFPLHGAWYGSRFVCLLYCTALYCAITFTCALYFDADCTVRNVVTVVLCIKNKNYAQKPKKTKMKITF